MFRSTPRWFPGIESGIATLLLVGMIVLPIAWVLGYSAAYSLGGIGLLSTGWTLDHWRSAFHTGGLRESLVFSATIATTVTLLSTSMALVFALSVSQTRKNPWTLGLLCIPLATPSAVMAVMTRQSLSSGGFLARLAFHFGLIRSPTEFPPLVNDPFSVGIIVALTASACPLLTLYFLKTWSAAQIDRYCQLAEALGATRLQSRLRIALPMLVSRSRAMIVLIWLLNLGSYEVPLILGRQSPQMFSVLTQRRFGQFDLHERPEAFALATAYLLLILIGLPFLVRRRPHA